MKTIVAIVGALLLGVLGNQLYDSSGWLARRAIKCASQLWSNNPEVRKTREEEWLAILDQCPGRLGQLAVALPFLFRGFFIYTRKQLTPATIGRQAVAAKMLIRKLSDTGRLAHATAFAVGAAAGIMQLTGFGAGVGRLILTMISMACLLFLVVRYTLLYYVQENHRLRQELERGQHTVANKELARRDDERKPFRVDFVFPASTGAPSVVVRSRIGELKAPRRDDETGNWVIEWRDGDPASECPTGLQREPLISVEAQYGEVMAPRDAC